MNDAINYSMSFTLQEIRNILNVDKKYVLDCLYHFPQHFSTDSKLSNPQRRFNLDDIRVLAYVLLYWEAEPDFYSITIGLDSNDQYGEEFDELISQIVPIFLEPNDFNIENTVHSVLLAGVADSNDILSLAKNYKRSGDELIKLAIENDEKYELAAPAIYCYRHAIELFLKSTITGSPKTHKLHILFSKFEIMLREKFSTEVPSWFKNIVLSLHEFDGSSTNFRYGHGNNIGEYLIDLSHFKSQMESMQSSFIIIESRLIADVT